MIANKNIVFMFILLVLLGSCKKDDVVLENPTQLSRPISLPITLYNIQFVPYNIFSKISLPANIQLLEDSVVQFILNEPFNVDWEFSLNLDMKGLIGNDERLSVIQNMHIFNDFNNGMPFSINSQLFAINGAGEIVETLLTDEQKQWTSPEVDAQGNIGEPILNKIDIELTKNQIQNMYNKGVTTIRFEANINSEQLFGQMNSPDVIMLTNSSVLASKMSIYINKPE